MPIEIIAPSPGESITQVMLASWLTENGAWVEKDAEVAEIESDKATLVVYAPESGKIEHLIAEGESIAVGSPIAHLTEGEAPVANIKQAEEKTTTPNPPEEKKQDLHFTPLAKKIAESQGIPKDQLIQLHKQKITRKDLQNLSEEKSADNSGITKPHKRVKMSPLRHKLAERLVSVKNETAMLTTFNEVDMGHIIAYREENKEVLTKKYGYNIGYISFFARAAAVAFAEFPHINAAIDGEDIIFYEYADICIAVNTPKGLLAPAIRDVQDLSLIEIEGHIRDFSVRAKENRIRIDELRDGTFTITNGGTYGSLLSTPIINPPQSAILGMHKIEDRPVAIEGKVVIRPMMYIALSYDHRLIDGKESVGFVMKVKHLLENPEELTD